MEQRIIEIEMKPSYKIVELSGILEAVLKLPVYTAGDALFNNAFDLEEGTIDIFTYIDKRSIPLSIYKLERIFDITLIGDGQEIFGGSLEAYTFKYKGNKVRLVFLKRFMTFEEVLRNMDISLRQIGYNENKFFVSEEALEGLNKKEMEVKNFDTLRATLKRIEAFEDLGFVLKNKEEVEAVKALF